MNKILIFSILASLLFSGKLVSAKNIDTASRSFSKFSDILSTHSVVTINKMIQWVSENGRISHNPYTGSSGMYYPGNTGSLVYTAGLLWGGYSQDGMDPELRLSGHFYSTETISGRILSAGVAQNPADPALRIYRIRRDYASLSLDELVYEAAILFNVARSGVTSEMRQQISAQYEQDWNEWPVEWGAPFYDLNQNGLYEPELGETPGLKNADQVLWFVINDINEEQTTRFSGSPGLGLEVQITLWAYKERPSDNLGNGIFQRYRLINKSGHSIDSLFVGQFSDPDVGNYGDDYVGCDTVLQLGYAYNALPSDGFFTPFDLAPPAVGYSFLQGPIVASPGDSAIYNYELKNDFRNLPLTSASYFAAGGAIAEPPPNTYETTLSLYNLLNGYTPQPDTINPIPYYIGSGPQRGEPTKFPLAGDPVTGTGDVDGWGSNYSPGDRRLTVASGPIQMLAGDVQEIIIAVVAGIDREHIYPYRDNLSSLQILKDFTQDFKQAHLSTPVIFNSTVSTTYPDSFQTAFTIQLDFGTSPQLTSCMLNFHSEREPNKFFELTLYDDGQHGDMQSGDNIWGNTHTIENQKYPFRADLTLNIEDGVFVVYDAVVDLTLRPVPVIDNTRLVWENGKQDGQINNFEKFRLGFQLTNPDKINTIDTLIVERLSYWSSSKLFQLSLPANTTVTNDSIYVDTTLPQTFTADSISIELLFVFDGHHTVKRLAFPVLKWLPHASRGTTLEVEALNGWPGNIVPVIADPSALNGHYYQVDFDQDASDSTLFFWQLTDLNLDEQILDHQPVGNSFADLYPVVNGIEFKVYNQQDFYDFQTVVNAAGPLDPPEGAAYPLAVGIHSFPQQYLLTDRQQTGSRQWIISAEIPYIFQYSEFLETITQNHSLWDRIIPFDYEIRFTAGNHYGVDTNGTIYSIPFELWNIGVNTPNEPNDDFRMIPLISDVNEDGLFSYTELDQSGYLPTDLFTWVLPDDQTPGSSGYQEEESAMLAGNWELNGDRIVFTKMLLSIFDRYPTIPPELPYVPEQGTVFRIITRKPPQAGDQFYITAPQPQPDNLYDVPKMFKLGQNYPNPFNHSTIIPFEFDKNGEASIEIFNVLGQRIKQVKRFAQPGLKMSYRWDGRNDQGSIVTTGVYFYRIRMDKQQKTKKMIFLR